MSELLNQLKMFKDDTPIALIVRACNGDVIDIVSTTCKGINNILTSDDINDYLWLNTVLKDNYIQITLRDNSIMGVR